MTDERKQYLIARHKAGEFPEFSATDEEKAAINRIVMAGEIEPFVLHHRRKKFTRNISRRAFDALQHLYWYYGCAPTSIVAKNDRELMQQRYPVLKEYFRQVPPECMEQITNNLQKGLIELDLFVREMYFSGKLLVDGRTYEDIGNITQASATGD